ncbi:MAG TPA: HAD-IB family phosphatase [Candidatus Saccharimonadales bacterium]|nr:HAD-IB family phosphatase [Candidatus Saccharimonadales bacterium]
MERPKLIVFDLNKTLIEENSWRDLNVAMGVTVQEDDMLVKWGREGVISDAEGQAILSSLYRQRGNPTREAITRILENYTFREGAEYTVRELGQRGYNLALISGSIDILVANIAQRLNITQYAANNVFIFDNHDMLTQIDTIDNDVAYKLDQLKAFCHTRDIELSECMAVGDGANDLLLFDATGCGVTFEGSPIQDRAKYVIRRLDDILHLVE